MRFLGTGVISRILLGIQAEWSPFTSILVFTVVVIVMPAILQAFCDR